jgi:hypothetical protein
MKGFENYLDAEEKTDTLDSKQYPKNGAPGEIPALCFHLPFWGERKSVSLFAYLLCFLLFTISRCSKLSCPVVVFVRGHVDTTLSNSILSHLYRHAAKYITDP